MADATNAHQTPLPFGPVRNSGLFSNHWLEHRLPLEPDWDAARDEARTALDALADLWREQRDLAPKYGDEQGLEQAFIQPALAALGWKLKCQTFLRGDKPDYALFLSQADLRDTIARDRTADDWWQRVAVVADAKAWHVRLDQRRGSGAKREFPPEQIERYLVRSGLDYGVLTNGRSWRLFPRTFDPGQRRYETYLEADLPAVLDAWLDAQSAGGTLYDQGNVLDDFLRFYLFFSPAGFRETGGRPPLVRRARLGSGEYRLGVGEGLKDRIFEALRLCIDGFLRFAPNGLSPTDDLKAARDAGFVLLYRLLFVLYAEDRGLLPYRRHKTYTDNRSLGRFRDDVAAESRSGFARLNPAATGYWQDLKALFALIDDGGARYGVPAYNGGLFDPDRHPFLEANALPDPVVARVLDQLGRAPDPQRPDLGLFRVDYRDLAIQHLGSVYEGMLELRPRVAGVAMRVVRKKQRRRKPSARYLPPAERTIKAGASVPAGFERTNTLYEVGDVYLETDKGERRATGSYYTPQHVVDLILDRTLGPLFDAINADIAADPDRLAGTFDDRVLDLRVLDPAMGSGHFLLGACQYAAEQIATSPFTADAEADALSGDESTLAFWKRRVVERCLYGVDKNPLAVELAKLALWLETVAEGRPLSFLDHHLRHGDSLVGAAVDELAAPPGTQDGGDLFAGAVSRQLPAMLSALSEIRTIRSESRDEIKQKERLFRDGLQRRREPFLAVADLWASTFLLPDGADVGGEKKPITRNLYQAALDALADPAALAALLGEPPYAQHLALARLPEHAALHWELEFPECFFTADGTRRPDAGFDAIIGNPPYLGVRTGTMSDIFKDTARKRFETATRNWDLFSLFIERSMALLAPDGHFGMIMPTRYATNKDFTDSRRLVLRRGHMTDVIDCGQAFDDPTIEATIYVNAPGPAVADVQIGHMRDGKAVARPVPADLLTLLPDEQFTTTLTSDEAPEFRRISRLSSRLDTLCTITRGMECGANDAAVTTVRGQRQVPVISGEGVTEFSINDQGLYIELGLDPVSKYKQPELFTVTPKLLVRFVAPHPIAGVDYAGVANFNTVYNLHPRQLPATMSGEDLLHCLAAWLNSKSIRWWFRKAFNSDESVYPHIQKYQLQEIPAPDPVADRAFINELAQLGRQARAAGTPHLDQINAAVEDFLKGKASE